MQLDGVNAMQAEILLALPERIAIDSDEVSGLRRDESCSLHDKQQHRKGSKKDEAVKNALIERA